MSIIFKLQDQIFSLYSIISSQSIDSICCVVGDELKNSILNAVLWEQFYFHVPHVCHIKYLQVSGGWRARVVRETVCCSSHQQQPARILGGLCFTPFISAHVQIRTAHSSIDWICPVFEFSHWRLWTCRWQQHNRSNGHPSSSHVSVPMRALVPATNTCRPTTDTVCRMDTLTSWTLPKICFDVCCGSFSLEIRRRVLVVLFYEPRKSNSFQTNDTTTADHHHQHVPNHAVDDQVTRQLSMHVRLSQQSHE